jgi:cyanophycin synthetase
MSTVTTPVKPVCLYCGNNPVSHRMSKMDSVLFLTLDPIGQWFLKTWLGRTILWGVDQIFLGCLWLGTKFGFMYFVPVPADIDSDRGKVLMDEAKARGYTTEALMVFGHLHDTYRVTFKNGKSIIFEGVPRLTRVNAMTSAWLDDKALMKQCLLAAHVPVPQGGAVSSWRAAKKLFETLQKPVIVKPRFGSRGRHTTTNITNLADYKIAFKRAKQLCVQVIVEEHYIGSVYRATCVDGKLGGVLAGDPPRITGDGVATIAQLIERKNDTRPARVAAVRITEKHLEFLRVQGYTLETVLPAGLTIDISEKIGLSYGGCSREVTDVTHPKLVTELERAAVATGDPLVGFDFITTSVEADPDTVQWGIIECNSVPFINLHHDPLIGTPVNVAANVWDWVERGVGVKN